MRHKKKYHDVTAERLKKMYPTEDWPGRYAKAMRIHRG